MSQKISNPWPKHANPHPLCIYVLSLVSWPNAETKIAKKREFKKGSEARTDRMRSFQDRNIDYLDRFNKSEITLRIGVDSGTQNEEPS